MIENDLDIWTAACLISVKNSNTIRHEIKTTQKYKLQHENKYI